MRRWNDHKLHQDSSLKRGKFEPEEVDNLMHNFCHYAQVSFILCFIIFKSKRLDEKGIIDLI